MQPDTKISGTQTSHNQETAPRALLVLLLVAASALILLCTRFHFGFLQNVFTLLAGSAAAYASFLFGRAYLALLTAAPALLSLFLPGADLFMLYPALLTPLFSFFLSFCTLRRQSRTIRAALLTVLTFLMNVAWFLLFLYSCYGTVSVSVFYTFYADLRESLIAVLASSQNGDALTALGLQAFIVDSDTISLAMQTILYCLPGLLLFGSAVSALLGDFCFLLFCRLCGTLDAIAPSSRNHEVSVVTSILYLLLSLVLCFLTIGESLSIAALNLYMILTPFLFVCGWRTYFRSADGQRLRISRCVIALILCFINLTWPIILIACSGAITTISRAYHKRNAQYPQS